MQSSPDIQGFNLPTVVAPKDTVCYKINVPNDPAHIQAFLGVLYDLTLWVSWQRDAAHTGVQAAQVWKKIWSDLVQSTDCDCPTPIAESEYEMSICEQLRFQNGVLQALCCGEWVTITGQPSQGIGGSGQPGDGSGSPAPGACQSYHAQMNGNEQWLCPAVVNAGDTVQVTNLTGAWNDGSVNWYCPTGQQFFAGDCTTSTTLNGADPLPTQPHMTLLTKIAGVYHNIGDGVSFTVPGGVTNALLILQPNDASLGDNSGEITFNIQVCNNQAATWSHYVDFTTAPHASPAGPYDFWNPGIGWQALVNGGGNYSPRVEMMLPTSTHVTALQPVYSNPRNSNNPPYDICDTYNGSGTNILAYNANDAHNAVIVGANPYIAGDSPATRRIEIGPNSTLSTPTVIGITVYGTGPEPVWP